MTREEFTLQIELRKRAGNEVHIVLLCFAFNVSNNVYI